MIRLLSGDARDVLPTLPDESVQCVVTSPPYYGLRDYGTALWDGGDAGCDHRESDRRSSRRLGVFHGGDDEFQTHPFRDTCGKCGAVRVDRQIGLEATPDEYLATMVGVFREIRRVLRRDGTCWVNMGDSYVHGPPHAGSVFTNGRNDGRPSNASDEARGRDGSISLLGKGLAPKQLLMMPARLALALQADGWWVRSDIIWHKPNPMPESCRDRPTSAHEHVFLLTRSARYFYDADAVREPLQDSTVERGYTAAHLVNGGGPKEHGNADKMVRQGKGWWDNAYVPSGRNLRNVWTIATEFPPELVERCIGAVALAVEMEGRADVPESAHEHVFLLTKSARYWYDADAVREELTGNTNWAQSGETPTERAGYHGANRRGSMSNPVTARNLRNVWTIATHAYSAAHFATFPPELAERCIKAGTRPGDTVLDPFAGAGTTLLVADRLQRDAVGIELNTTYTEMAMERCRADAPLFTAFPPAEPPEDERMGDLFAGDEYQHAPPVPKPMQVPRGWDTGPGAHGTIHRTGRTMPDMAAD